mgnify:CR=1 FL=1
MYSFESDYITLPPPNECEPQIGVDGNYDYKKGLVEGAISFVNTNWDASTGAYLVQGVDDINGIPPKFLRDITIGADGQFNNIRFTINSVLYEISGIVRVVSDFQFFATTITANGLPYVPGGAVPSGLALKSTTYNTVAGGFGSYKQRLSDVGFSEIFKNVNQGNPNVIYETIDKFGNRVVDENGNIGQTFSIELRAQADILKSIYIGVLPDPAKPTVFNLTDVIGYDLSLQKKPRITPLGRHAGYYQPTSKDIFFFRDPYLKIDFDNVTGMTGSTGLTGSTGGYIEDEAYKFKVKELCRYTNTQFNSSDIENFAQVKNLFYHKVNEEDPSTVLELSTDSAYLSLYPLINEVGIAKRDFYTFSSNWEPAYFRKSIDKSQIESIIGTKAMTEKKSFFGSKYLKVPQQIELETFVHSLEEDFNVVKDIKQPTLVDGTFITSENKTSIKFYLFIQKRLIEYLFTPVKEQFLKYIKPEFSYNDIETLDDDVERYITQNILSLYKVSNVDFYTKSTREESPSNYRTAELTNSEKSASGLSINTSVGSTKLNNNPFDLSLIYNKRKGFTESFGFSITIVKK